MREVNALKGTPAVVPPADQCDKRDETGTISHPAICPLSRWRLSDDPSCMHAATRDFLLGNPDIFVPIRLSGRDGPRDRALEMSRLSAGHVELHSRRFWGRLRCERP